MDVNESVKKTQIMQNHFLDMQTVTSMAYENEYASGGEVSFYFAKPLELRFVVISMMHLHVPKIIQCR